MRTKYHSFYYKYTRYPPSILMVAESSAQALKIKQDLENSGCQVYFTGACCDDLARACQKYFDLIVLDVDQSSEHGSEVYQTLKSYPELADIPLVYLMAKDASAAVMLLQIINQVHYLTYRYL